MHLLCIFKNHIYFESLSTCNSKHYHCYQALLDFWRFKLSSSKHFFSGEHFVFTGSCIGLIGESGPRLRRLAWTVLIGRCWCLRTLSGPMESHSVGIMVLPFCYLRSKPFELYALLWISKGDLQSPGSLTVVLCLWMQMWLGSACTGWTQNYTWSPVWI